MGANRKGEFGLVPLFIFKTKTYASAFLYSTLTIKEKQTEEAKLQERKIDFLPISETCFTCC